MKYIKTTIESYNLYITENKTDKISKDERLYCSNFSPNHPLYEITYNPLKTNYNILTSNNDYKILFKTNSNTEYKLDLIKIKSESKWEDLIHYSISFSLSNSNSDNYHELTMLKELYELFDRIMYILLDFINDKKIIFVIGNPFDKRKNILYMDFIESFRKHKNIEIIKDQLSFFGSEFDDSNWAYFIKIN